MNFFKLSSRATVGIVLAQIKMGLVATSFLPVSNILK